MLYPSRFPLSPAVMITMRSVSEILRQARSHKGLSFHEIERQTKIKVSYLEAMENGDWSKLPPPTFTKGLIRNYAQFLGLKADDIVAKFRREFDEKKTVTPSSPKLEHTATFFRITPTILIRLSVVLIAIAFLAYFYHEYNILTGPPNLSVISPKQNQVLSGNTVHVVGNTSAEATVTINGQPVLVSPDGTFEASIDLTQDTPIKVTATGKSGKSSTIERVVILNNSQ